MLHNTRAQGALMRPGEDVAALREILSELLALPEANLRTPEGPTRAAELMRSAGGSCLISATARGSRARPALGGPGEPRSCEQFRTGWDSGVPVRVNGHPDGYICWVGAEPGAHGVPLAVETAQQQLVSALQHWFGAPRAA